MCGTQWAKHHVASSLQGKNFSYMPALPLIIAGKYPN